MSDYAPGYIRPIGGLTEAGAITKLRQDSRIIGQPQGDGADPERKNWVVLIKNDCVKIYENVEEANKDNAHRPNNRSNTTRRYDTFKPIPSQSPRNFNGGRIMSPVFHHLEVDRIKAAEENLAAAQASYSEFENPLSEEEPQHVHERWIILKEISHQKVILAEQELKLARFDEMRLIRTQQEELEAKLERLNTTCV